MVLRRPYAFLIKYFKLIHLIITAILAYVIFSFKNIYSYLSLVIKDSANRYDALEHISYGIYFWIILAVLLCLAIYYLFKYKDKPRKIYIVTIVGYVIIGVFLIVLFNYMNGFLNSVVNQKSIRLYRDILLVTILFQSYLAVVMLIRGMGFDIKKFNFNKDVQELNLTDSDSEEIEVNTTIDTTNIMRSVRKGGREFSYFLKEFKVYIIAVLAIVVAIFSYKIYKYVNVKVRVYGENQTVGSTYKIAVLNSYYDSIDDKNYVIVSFQISKSGKGEKFNYGSFVLNTANKQYTADKNICSKFGKYGTCYKKQIINSTKKNYILVYPVENFKKNKSYVIYNDYYDTTYKVKLSPKIVKND